MKKGDKTSTVDPRNVKSSNYKRAMKEIVREKVCPFCPKTFKWHTKPILKTVRQWFITESFNPYKNAKHHFLIIGKKHKENFSELTSSDWKDINSLIVWVFKNYGIKGAGIILRFGDTLYSGATIKHLHFHLISPKVIKGSVKPVYFPIG